MHDFKIYVYGQLDIAICGFFVLHDFIPSYYVRFMNSSFLASQKVSFCIFWFRKIFTNVCMYLGVSAVKSRDGLTTSID